MSSLTCSRSEEVCSGSVPSLGRFLGCARNDAHYNYSSRGGADGACCHFDRAKRVESTVISTKRSEWRNLMLGGTAKKDLCIPVSGSLHSRCPALLRSAAEAEKSVLARCLRSGDSSATLGMTHTTITPAEAERMGSVVISTERSEWSLLSFRPSEA